MTIETSIGWTAAATSSRRMPCDPLREGGHHVVDVARRHGGEERQGEDPLGRLRGVRQRGGQVAAALAVQAVEVERGEMEPDPDVLRQELVDDRVAADAERLELEADDEKMPRVPRRV